MAVVKQMSLDADATEEFYELTSLRCQLLVKRLLAGLKLSEEKASELLSNLEDDGLTKQDIEIRDRLKAGIDNLIEFAVCEEYQAISDVPDDYDMDDPEDLELLEDISETYHLRYASVENGDVEYAAAIALKWVTVYSAATWVTYMTMNDDRVRPWHRALEGFSAPRDSFPEWMIPPIEWGCRCYLEDVHGNSVENKLSDVLDKIPAKPKELDDIFSESLAKCGRIFGKSHPYFKVKKGHKQKLAEYVERLKKSYYGD